MRRNTPADFWARVQMRGEDECWPWTGRVKPPTRAFPQGHGVYDHDGTWDYAHRYAYFLTYGHFPEPIGRHTCDNPVCCNPKHTIPGTRADNARDRDQRGRRIGALGEEHGMSKLKRAEVDEIRATYVPYSHGPTSARALAAKFGVSISMISRIVRGDNWK